MTHLAVMNSSIKNPYSQIRYIFYQSIRLSLVILSCSYPSSLLSILICTPFIHIYIYIVFGMTRPGIEPLSPGPLAYNLPTRPIYTGLVGRVFANSPGDRQWSGRLGFNPRSSHTKDLKMVSDTSLLITQQYKVRIKGKVV